MPTNPKTHSPTGWWLVAILEKNSDPEQAPYWNNYILIRADFWEDAFHKATERGLSRVAVSKEAFDHPAEFIGITDMVPIYEDFQDGAEILWQEIWPDEDEPLNDNAPLEVYSLETMRQSLEN